MLDARDTLRALSLAKATLVQARPPDLDALCEGPAGTKKDIVAAIAACLGVEAPPMSRGSTEPREIFLLIDRHLVLGIAPSGRGSKPALAKAIVDSAACELWLPDYGSTGSTVTVAGLRAVLRAVRWLTR